MIAIIQFYSQNKLYGEFSNFYESSIIVDNMTFPTTEHYFQAMKYSHDKEYFEKIRTASSAGLAAKLGRNKNRPMRSDWENVKDGIMMVALKAKFTQHANLKKLLLDTSDAILIEHTKNDSYWGDGGDGTGKNMLGKSLMELRKQLA